jgi:hypothetical protein
MGVYVYRVTSEVIKLDDGRKAHIAKYAYKPYSNFGDENRKWNARMHFRTGCTASHRLKLKSDLIATVDREGLLGKLYENPGKLRVFYDDNTFGTKYMPVVGCIMRAGTRWKIDPLKRYDGEPR